MGQNKEKIIGQAEHLFTSGFHCAEAIVYSVLEGMGEDPSVAAAHATAFGGGIGITFEEICGAVSGGLIVIGHFFGRKAPGEPWDLAALLAADLRTEFLRRFDTTRCGVLKDRFGKENQPKECTRIVGLVAADVMDLLSKAKEELRLNPD